LFLKKKKKKKARGRIATIEALCAVECIYKLCGSVPLVSLLFPSRLRELTPKHSFIFAYLASGRVRQIQESRKDINQEWPPISRHEGLVSPQNVRVSPVQAISLACILGLISLYIYPMVNNVAALGGGAVAILYADLGGLAGANLVNDFVGGNFSYNTVTAGSGGGVYVVFPSDKPILPDIVDPTEIVSRKWNYTGNWNILSGVYFGDNQANCSSCMGGAFYLDSGQTRLVNSTFFENEAGFFGGALLVAGTSTSISASGCEFSYNSALEGKDIYSFAGGSLGVSSCTFVEAEEETPSGSTFFNAPQGEEDVSFYCKTATTESFALQAATWKTPASLLILSISPPGVSSP